MRIYRNFKESNSITLFNGDCRKLLKRLPDESVDLVVTSPPYCIGKAYEDPHDDIETFRKQHQDIFSDLYRVVKPGGSICWQIGYHVSDKCVVPLDYIIYDIFTSMSEELDNPLILRNRIVWTFGHGLNSTTRFSGRHEMILWFTKGLQTIFNLDEVRIPQKYPGKRFYKGPNKGQLSGNPMGKNPSDVWDIPNVKAKHIEKTDHPCQFPVAIPQRLIKALTNKNGLVLDPFMGSGTTGVAALIEGRRFVGSEIQKSYFDISVERIKDASDGKAKIREDRPVTEPNPNAAVAKLPDEFRRIREAKDGNAIEEYVKFCVSTLRNYFGAIKKNLRRQWDDTDSKLLSVISINGFIIALTRQLSVNGVNDFAFYDRIFNGWTIDFSKDGFKYTSSQYRKFSTQILREVFQISDEIIATI